MNPIADDDFTPGRVVPLSELISRVTAPNGGKMTGPGTNTYLIGRAGGADVAILDPGPASPAHVDALLAAVAGRRVVALVVTHTHLDHSPAASPLRARTGAPRVGRTSSFPQFQDPTFQSDLEVRDGTTVSGDGWTLRAVPTPGHASNHVCWLLEEEAALFTGDHVLGTTSPVILPPDGSMRAYLDSLARLQQLSLRELMPGHGPRLLRPARVFELLVRHRLDREAEVVAALARAPQATVPALVDIVYRDVSEDLKRWAAFSLEAHLIKLAEDGRAFGTDGRWQLAADPA
jgi:glyoxylase-like metal-dependent hydrolase (beta-lactamase superfamily II)